MRRHAGRQPAGRRTLVPRAARPALGPRGDPRPRRRTDPRHRQGGRIPSRHLGEPQADPLRICRRQRVCRTVEAEELRDREADSRRGASGYRCVARIRRRGVPAHAALRCAAQPRSRLRLRGDALNPPRCDAPGTGEKIRSSGRAPDRHTQTRLRTQKIRNPTRVADFSCSAATRTSSPTADIRSRCSPGSSSPFGSPASLRTRRGCYRTYSRMAATIAAFPATIETPRSCRSACTTPPASCTINSPAQTSHSCSASSQ